MKKKNFTMIPNVLLSECQLSIPARLLLCVLFKYSFQKDYCWPSQETLGKDLGRTPRHVRNLLKELENTGLIDPERLGWNRTNTYKISKNLQSTRVPSEYDGNATSQQKQSSSHLGTIIPLHQGTTLPTKNTYGSRKENNGSNKGLESMRHYMEERGLIKKSNLQLKSADIEAK